MAQGLDVDAMLARFRERAAAVKNRPLPPVAGEERTLFVKQAQLDFQDFAIVGDANGHDRGRSFWCCGSICARKAPETRFTRRSR